MILKALYLRYLGNRVFNKLLLLYSTIIIVTIGLLIFIIVYNITSILREQAINYNKQILQTVNNYFYNQNKSFKKIMNSFYTESWGKNGQMIGTVEELFKHSTDSNESKNFNEQLSATRMVNDFLLNIVQQNDFDTKDSIVVNPNGDLYLSGSKNQMFPSITDYIANIYKYISDNKPLNINSKKTYIIPPLRGAEYPNSENIYCIYDYLRDFNNSSHTIGYLVTTYNVESVKNAYSQFSKYLIGNIMIVADDGSVIFDSSEKFYNQPFQKFEKIKTSKENTVRDKDYIINVIRNNEFGFTVVGMISKSELYKNVNYLNKYIILIAIIAIMLIIALTFLSTKSFSKRIRNIIGTLLEIQKGNLSARVHIKGYNDEIEQISNNLNLMSERLDEYIKKVYVSELRRTDAELKQKTAEVYALQSQINPHFLYNTLEAIRMRALSTGDKSTGDMIKILAKLFRSSIKDEMVVTLKEEISYSKSYLELYSIRYGDKLEAVYDIDPDILEYAVIKHLLQPIIENSIIHGINLNNGNNIITIKGIISNDLIEISVKDNGHGMDEKKLRTIVDKLKTPRIQYKESIGIYNVESRIKLIYGNDYGLKINSKPGVGTEVVLKIMALTKEELLKNVQNNDC